MEAVAGGRTASTRGCRPSVREGVGRRTEAGREPARPVPRNWDFVLQTGRSRETEEGVSGDHVYTPDGHAADVWRTGLRRRTQGKGWGGGGHRPGAAGGQEEEEGAGSPGGRLDRGRGRWADDACVRHMCLGAGVSGRGASRQRPLPGLVGSRGASCVVPTADRQVGPLRWGQMVCTTRTED